MPLEVVSGSCMHANVSTSHVIRCERRSSQVIGLALKNKLVPPLPRRRWQCGSERLLHARSGEGDLRFSFLNHFGKDTYAVGSSAFDARTATPARRIHRELCSGLLLRRADES